MQSAAFELNKMGTTIGTLGHNSMTQKYLNELTHTIIGAAIEVHKEIGPGLLESIYEKCLSHLLKEKGLQIIMQQLDHVVELTELAQWILEEPHLE